ncbi:MAG: pentapeptide repeat-containing protein [Nostoc sp. SerVER01]|uniref:pentapeptide repeat-containing protein n=1 Tax=Nostoc sp. CCY 9925 TaxID=3103865 RepID=UPI002AD9DFB8|nr:pentapeptide repeat-containing protein [Nostoc sp. SerVER01]MDZ8025634.1 pentapeptide repeat-containing protein [Nostoc sp. DedQUE11]MDZ8075709.1 pentapeptide repeat-containing protein [Nostoc sp. DedQUE01]MDZ8083661.1 pentapeptide repeat-containing protein [Nostoc sp. DcaGUA01]
MLTVIINAFHVMRNILPTNNNLFSKIFLKIYDFPEQLKQIPYHSPKQRLQIAIEQLGNHTMETSVAIISDLEQIAHNHPQYHWIIMDILTSFIRKNAAYTPQKQVISNPGAKVRGDIQAALTVIARRDVNKDPDNEQLDLSHTDIRGANLNKANLEQMNLYQANLAGANLAEANLEGAILSAANLERANLYSANLKGAILSACNLQRANLQKANLHRASLYLANLHGVILNDAILDGANFREAKFSE